MATDKEFTDFIDARIRRITREEMDKVLLPLVNAVARVLPNGNTTQSPVPSKKPVQKAKPTKRAVRSMNLEQAKARLAELEAAYNKAFDNGNKMVSGAESKKKKAMHNRIYAARKLVEKFEKQGA